MKTYKIGGNFASKLQGVGEDLREAGVADESVDAVVMTLVLCTVDDQIK